jgi:hypothetical protein
MDVIMAILIVFALVGFVAGNYVVLLLAIAAMITMMVLAGCFNLLKAICKAGSQGRR